MFSLSIGNTFSLFTDFNIDLVCSKVIIHISNWITASKWVITWLNVCMVFLQEGLAHDAVLTIIKVAKFMDCNRTSRKYNLNR